MAKGGTHADSNFNLQEGVNINIDCNRRVERTYQQRRHDLSEVAGITILTDEVRVCSVGNEALMCRIQSPNESDLGVDVNTLFAKVIAGEGVHQCFYPPFVLSIPLEQKVRAGI